MRKFDPNHGLKKIYAKIKTVGIDNVGIEKTVFKILEPLNHYRSNSINKTKIFRIEFQKHKHKLYLEKHEIVSYDAENLFTKIDINLTIDFLIEQIYQKPTYFFKTIL